MTESKTDQQVRAEIPRDEFDRLIHDWVNGSEDKAEDLLFQIMEEGASSLARRNLARVLSKHSDVESILAETFRDVGRGWLERELEDQDEAVAVHKREYATADADGEGGAA